VASGSPPSRTSSRMPPGVFLLTASHPRMLTDVWGASDRGLMLPISSYGLPTLPQSASPRAFPEPDTYRSRWPQRAAQMGSQLPATRRTQRYGPRPASCADPSTGHPAEHHWFRSTFELLGSLRRISSAEVHTCGAPHSRGFPPPLRSALAVSTTSTVSSFCGPATCFSRKRPWDCLLTLQSIPPTCLTAVSRVSSAYAPTRLGSPSRGATDHHALCPSSLRGAVLLRGHTHAGSRLRPAPR